MREAAQKQQQQQRGQERAVRRLSVSLGTYPEAQANVTSGQRQDVTSGQ